MAGGMLGEAMDPSGCAQPPKGLTDKHIPDAGGGGSKITADASKPVVETKTKDVNVGAAPSMNDALMQEYVRRMTPQPAGSDRLRSGENYPPYPPDYESGYM